LSKPKYLSQKPLFTHYEAKYEDLDNFYEVLDEFKENDGSYELGERIASRKEKKQIKNVYEQRKTNMKIPHSQPSQHKVEGVRAAPKIKSNEAKFMTVVRKKKTFKALSPAQYYETDVSAHVKESEKVQKSGKSNYWSNMSQMNCQDGDVAMDDINTQNIEMEVAAIEKENRRKHL